MGDEAKTREQLVSELAGMRRRVVQLEALEIEHQRAEKAVLQSEERLRIAGDGTVLYANEAGQPLLGLWECQLGQCVSVDWQRLVSDVVRSGFRKESEVQCDERTLLLTFAPTAGTEYVNVYGLDITERKRAEEALRRRNQGLALLNQAGRELTATLDLQQVVERALQAVTETIGAEDASVWLWDEE